MTEAFRPPHRERTERRRQKSPSEQIAGDPSGCCASQNGLKIPFSPTRSSHPKSHRGSWGDREIIELDGSKNPRQNGALFFSLAEAQVIIEAWRRHDNALRPHSSLKYDHGRRW